MHPILRILRTGTVLLLLIATLLATTKSAGAQTKSLRLASTAWSPFTNATGKPRFASDLVHTALERLGINEETAIIEENRLSAALINGEFDGSAALWRDDARERALIYSRPYLQNRLILVGRTGSDVSAKTLAALSGKKLALVEGYAYGERVKDPKGPTYIPSRSEEDSLQKVLDGSADYTLIDEIVVEYLVQNYPKESRSKLAFGSVPLIFRTLHFAVRRSLPDAQRIIDRFNAEMLAMIADHSYNRLLHLEWIQADVDGDGRPEWVPLDDRAGIRPPDHSYRLFMDSATEPASSPRFYLGGKVYPSWSDVPEAYKAPRPGGTFSDGAQFTIFEFKF